MAIQLAFHPIVKRQAPEFCAAIVEAVNANPPFFSIGVSQVPFATHELALLLDPPVLPICLDEFEALCGPLYIPGRTVCPKCLDHWVDNNMPGREEHQTTLDPEIARGLIDHVAGWSRAFSVAGRVEELERGAVALAYRDWRASWHSVVPLRNCARCGGLAAHAPASPEAHCSRRTGIVTRVEASCNPSAGAFRAIGYWSPPVPVGNARPYLSRQNSYGRGRTSEEAERGCIGEAIERYSLVYRGDEQTIRARFVDIDAIHPDAIQLFSESQFQEREEWNSEADEIFSVYEPFDTGERVEWIAARGLGREKHVKFVPAACCLMWYQFEAGEREFARADTVGCGTGATFEDALAHALLEWIERDSMAIWWENRLRRPAVRLESFESEELNEVATGLRAIGRDLFLLDCTTDVGIPAYVSVAPRFDGSEPLFAGAAHWSAKVAAFKAATEPGQIWYAAKVLGGATDSVRRWLLDETLGSQPYLEPCGFVDAPEEIGISRTDTVAYIVDRLEAAGLRTYAVDHSRADTLWPMVRAVVPGLRHIWNRRAPGRLYEVPVKGGWIQKAFSEGELNPIRCMI